ncbi:MAG: hypothetical protein RL398_1862 [Planctomycetota bacterium]
MQSLCRTEFLLDRTVRTDRLQEVVMLRTHRDSSRALGYAKARRAAHEWVDVYRPLGKLYPAVCRDCGATEFKGRWSWQEGPPDLPKVLCPACERIRDGVAAHVLVLEGDLGPWWEEVSGILAHVERQERAEHPLERLMPLQIERTRILLPTTGLHLARRATAALVRRFRRHLRLTFDDRSTKIEWL